MTKTRPSITYPLDWKLEEEEIIGAEKVFKVFKDRINAAQTK